MTAPFSIAGLTVPPGGRVRGAVDLVELADGTRVKLPLLVLNGAAPGPSLYLGAAIHGDEVNGTAILARALRAVDPARLKGRIVCVPVQHPLSFQADHRVPIAQFMKSPLDQAPIDAWTCFPGDAGGNLAQIVAAALFALVRQCGWAIDIHTPTRGGRYVPIAILPGRRFGAASERAEWLAGAFGTGYVMRTEAGMYVSDGILCVEATRAGIPAFTFEIGEGGRLEEPMIAIGARCVGNALRGLGMIEGAIEPPPTRYVMRDFLGLRAERGGLLMTEAPLGMPVKRGDRLARILDIYGDEAQLVTAPEDGIFVRATTLSTVSTGERVATLGLLA